MTEHSEQSEGIPFWYAEDNDGAVNPNDLIAS